VSLFHLEKQAEALLLMMDSHITDEYERAMEIISERVRVKTKSRRLLACGELQPDQRRVASCSLYWKMRKMLFGDRW